MNGTSPESSEDQRSSNLKAQKRGNALFTGAKNLKNKVGLSNGFSVFLKMARGEKSKKVFDILTQKTASAVTSSKKYQTRAIFVWKMLSPAERYIVGLFAIVVVAGLVGLV